jgi:ribosomal protein S15
MFGRHVTDHTLPPDPGAPVRASSNKTPRAGPDTGSSEVQAAILTVKIRNLSRHLELIGRTDKHNKRNLRLLVHKRQKHLKYLKRKEKGGVRWRNIMDVLGLDDEAVQNEIMMR